MERDQSPRVKKERKPAFRGKWESVFSGRHMDNVPKETHVVSVMTSKPQGTVAKVRDEKDNRLLVHPTRRQNRLTARDKHPHRDQAVNMKTHLIRVKFHADSNSFKIRHVNSGIFRVSGDKCISDMLRQKEKPSKKSKKGGAKDQLLY